MDRENEREKDGHLSFRDVNLNGVVFLLEKDAICEICQLINTFYEEFMENACTYKSVSYKWLL